MPRIHTIRPVIGLWAAVAMLVILAACTSPAGSPSEAPATDPPTDEATASAAGQPTDEATPAPTDAADATIVFVEGVTVGGPGATIADALSSAGDEPVLVNGILLKDLDDTIWLCESLTESSPPGCGEPRLRVENYPINDALWDLANAADTGLQEEDGVMWLEGNQLYGEVRP